VQLGDVVFHVSGFTSILKAERGFKFYATNVSYCYKTNNYVQILKGTGTKILDTRKTTPGFRAENGSKK
jgi:nicotinate-nucleotide pyrophosphorylase (carboxylating)